MTIPEIATRLGVHSSRVRHDMLEGRLLAEKQGRDWFVRVEEYERYSAARRPRGRPRRRPDPQPDPAKESKP